jgi:hypothetical protein
MQHAEMGLVLLQAETEWSAEGFEQASCGGVVQRWTEHGCTHAQMVAQNRIRPQLWQNRE